jgi:hypothetical protein
MLRNSTGGKVVEVLADWCCMLRNSTGGKVVEVLPDGVACSGIVQEARWWKCCKLRNSSGICSIVQEVQTVL